MPLNLPTTSSGPRAPDKQRPRPLPKHVRRMLELMVRGRPDDPDYAPLSFIEAGRLAGIKPDIARKWLDRPEVRSFLRAERKAFREAINCGNEAALARVRDTSDNGLAVVRSVQALEQLDEQHATREGRGGPALPGFVILVSNAPANMQRSPVVIEHESVPAVEPPEPKAPAVSRTPPRRR
jgi:hypothetical protein